MKTARLIAAGAVSLGLVSLSAGVAPRWQPSGESKAVAAPGIAAVAFMAGQWRDRADHGTTEEHWSRPEGNNVMGMFRWLKPDGTPQMFEILTITEEKDGVLLRLRHFSANLAPTMEKDGPAMTLRLAESGATRAVFRAAPGETHLSAVTYACPDADTLTIKIEFPDPAREPLEFRLKRLSDKAVTPR